MACTASPYVTRRVIFSFAHSPNTRTRLIDRYLQEQTSQMDSGSLLLGFLDFYGNHFDPRLTGISVGRSRYFSRSAPLPAVPAPPQVGPVPGAPSATRLFYGQVRLLPSLSCVCRSIPSALLLFDTCVFLWVGTRPRTIRKCKGVYLFCACFSWTKRKCIFFFFNEDAVCEDLLAVDRTAVVETGALCR